MDIELAFGKGKSLATYHNNPERISHGAESVVVGFHIIFLTHRTSEEDYAKYANDDRKPSHCEGALVLGSGRAWFGGGRASVELRSDVGMARGSRRG